MKYTVMDVQSFLIFCMDRSNVFIAFGSTILIQMSAFRSIQGLVQTIHLYVFSLELLENAFPFIT